MLAPSDLMWDVKAREKAAEDDLIGKIDSLERAMNVIRRASALRHATGFQDLVKAMEWLVLSAGRKLENDTRLTDSGLREQRGYVRALNDVMALLVKEGQTEHLASQLEGCKNLLAEARCHRPSPKHEVST